MTAVRLVSKLLKFKGFRAVGFWWERWGRDFVVAVKPYKNGCLCPKCGNRGKIVRTLKPRYWRDSRVCGQTVWFVYVPGRFDVAPMARWWKRSRGRPHPLESPTGSSMRCSGCALT